MASPVTKEISYEELKALVGKSQNLLLVDVRSKEEVDKGRIPGSVHIPIDSVEAALAMEPEEFKAKYGVTKPLLDASELVFHCQVGKRGGIATDKACKVGYVNARNYQGAYREWSQREGK
ncbi:thiosulfate:glutathione sulfurtransferase [Pempheris klunzingeri]|uniref:thiosulfate:glutathione sulfurtransferase n=1 Tax=Pempheris klunzingeri TaxID=3127111 RepID=UPI0039809DE1